MRFRFKTGGVLIAIAGLATAVQAVPAAATVAVSSFTLTPASTQAGAAPDLAISTSFAPSSGDTPKSIAMHLAPGLLANPTVPSTCSQTDLQANQCPATSQVGSGTVTATQQTLLGGQVSGQAKVYMVTPQTGEAGRIGVVASTGLGTIVVQGVASVRTSPAVGADVTFSDLPNQVGGVSVSVTGMQMTLNGTVDGKAFTRNPTSCAPAVTTMQVTSYSGQTSSASTSFTPTGCTALSYAPQLTAKASVSGSDGATQLTTTITQSSGESASSAAKLTLPSLTARSDATSRECTAADLSTCPASSVVGSATIATPLWATPISGKVVVVPPPSGSNLPAIAIVTPAPFGIVLKATNSLSSGGISTTMTGMPDAPITSAQITIDGGPDSLFVGGWYLCTNTSKASGTFTGQNGATSSVSAPVTTTCA